MSLRLFTILISLPLLFAGCQASDSCCSKQAHASGHGGMGHAALDDCCSACADAPDCACDADCTNCAECPACTDCGGCGGCGECGGCTAHGSDCADCGDGSACSADSECCADCGECCACCDDEAKQQLEELAPAGVRGDG